MLVSSLKFESPSGGTHFRLLVLHLLERLQGEKNLLHLPWQRCKSPTSLSSLCLCEQIIEGLTDVGAVVAVVLLNRHSPCQHSIKL